MSAAVGIPALRRAYQRKLIGLRQLSTHIRQVNALQSRMATTTAKANRTFVPDINIAPFLKDSKSDAALEVINATRQACLTTGFFQITGHGLAPNLQQELFQAAKKFFSLPLSQKSRLDARNQLGRRGYDVLESESFDSTALPDLKEGFYIGHDLTLQDPPVQQGRFFMGPNVWPEEAILPHKDFQAPVQRYFAAINSLAVKILELVARTLPHGPRVFDTFTSGYVVAPLRLLHYPPAKPSEGLKQHGAGAHTDFGAITLLLQDQNSGLEVLDNQSGEFIPIPPTPDAFVVNIGDMLSAWTGGAYKSSVHRVMNPNPVDRYSAAFFYDGNVDCALDPLDGSEPTVKDWTVEKHMIKRIRDSYDLK